MVYELEDNYFDMMFPKTDKEVEEEWCCTICLTKLDNFFDECSCCSKETD